MTGHDARTDHENSQISRQELREATLAGVRWTMLGRLGAEVFTFMSAVALARLIEPAEFGRVAVALIVPTIAASLLAQGFGSPVVQRKSLERAHLEVALLMSIVTGLLLLITCVLLAAPVFTPLFGDRTSDLIVLTAPVFLLGGLGVVPQALLQRRLDFRRLSTIEVVTILCGAGSAVALATFAGLDAEAVILGALVKSALSAALMQASTPLVVPRWRRKAGGEIAGFGGPAAAASLVRAGVRNLDYAILAAKLSAAQVGFYWRAFQFGVEHQRKLTDVMIRVSYPVYSRSESLDHLHTLRRRIVRVNATVILPLLALFIAVAPTFIPWLLGARWEPAVVPAQILALAGAATALNGGTGPLVLASGRPRHLLNYNLAHLAAYAVAVFVAASYGIVAVAAAVVAVEVAALTTSWYFLHWRLVGIPMRDLARDAVPAGVSSTTTLLLCVPAMHMLDAWGLTPLLSLPCVGALGLATYLVMLRLLFRAAWSDLVLLASRVLPRRTSRPASLGHAGAAGAEQPAS